MSRRARDTPLFARGAVRLDPAVTRPGLHS
jgi:hypothetical protein